MAQRATYYAHDEYEEDLGDVNIEAVVGNYGVGVHGGGYEDDQARIDEATMAAMQHQMAQQVAFAQIPDVVKRFIVQFHQAVLDNNLPEITNAYDQGWNRLTEKYYSKSEWPEAELIAPLVNDDPIFLILYRELYYRHVYSKLQPEIDDRFHSYENSCELFNYLLNSEGPVQLELPDQWLWDIIDEFIYQFQSFCVWRARPTQKTDEELMMLADGSQVWSCYSVLNVLYSLIQKSHINEYLEAVQRGASAEEITEISGEYGQRPTYRTLGFFSIIGLLRVHVLLGDYTLALKVMDLVKLNQKAFFTRVTACHVATYYYVGFCYMSLKRYSDATRTFNSILNFISRMRQYHTRSYQYDQINRTADRMYALLAICNALSPSRLDDAIMTNLKEKYGEQHTKMTKGGEEGMAAFEELYTKSCPKFISSTPPPYHDSEVLNLYINSPPQEPMQRHLSLFLSDVRTQQSVVPTLRSFLKMYSSLDAAKLAGFLDADEEEIVQQMMVMKNSSRSLSRAAAETGTLLDGSVISTSDLDFVIDENMVQIVESTIGRRYGGWFIRNTEHALKVYDTIRSSPLPISKTNIPVAETQASAATLAANGPATGSAPKPKAAWGAQKTVRLAA
ncbi:Eukaryotic translation initiation factor 3 subunit L OS=Ustilago maydis (strain 521 / FGSC 9021) GN=UM01228 PE=3 SV=1 [Rhizoctonia solani AG-1 IB]|uniref:Eukaryotic translation initiation factor 3 subunit L n=1 Tax=Thanatephorus cucumeris (strain AG1-IB / isolate 7/3/14) TaxID=1108050 RepID=A0A0B7F9M0_THACB|nr:Eukaryotic translation initiation factor 3 subunit L OS=Ustilago maydis (strain 521 / FGSC 9021) GN=UM01228 PE=3 SV=1 [Rhizoctonia solani AG-1 IB]